MIIVSIITFTGMCYGTIHDSIEKQNIIDSFNNNHSIIIKQSYKTTKTISKLNGWKLVNNGSNGTTNYIFTNDSDNIKLSSITLQYHYYMEYK